MYNILKPRDQMETIPKAYKLKKIFFPNNNKIMSQKCSLYTSPSSSKFLTL